MPLALGLDRNADPDPVGATLYLDFSYRVVAVEQHALAAIKRRIHRVLVGPARRSCIAALALA